MVGPIEINSAKGAFMPQGGFGGSRLWLRRTKRVSAGVEVRPTEIARRILESFDPREREALMAYYLELRNSRTVEVTFEFTKEEFSLLRQRARALFREQFHGFMNRKSDYADSHQNRFALSGTGGGTALIPGALPRLPN